MEHRAGFVNILGNPNVGKSTLMNRLVGEKLSIITSKSQTTRHRIKGIVNGEDCQIVVSDTPGVVKRCRHHPLRHRRGGEYREERRLYRESEAKRGPHPSGVEQN